MGDPRTAGQIWSHLRGANYTDFKGAWGFDLARVGLAAKFIWEEFLGVGLAVLAIGLWRLGKERPRSLALLGAWAGPMLFLPLVFVGEGMFDQWFVTAYLPLAFCHRGRLRLDRDEGPRRLPGGARHRGRLDDPRELRRPQLPQLRRRPRPMAGSS